jgi:hypothetical protein
LGEYQGCTGLSPPIHLALEGRKKKLEDAERKAKDAAADLQVVVEGKSSLLPWADSVFLL